MRIETRVMTVSRGRSDGAPKGIVEIELVSQNGPYFPISRNTSRELALRALMADQQLTDEYRRDNYTDSDENFEVLHREKTDEHILIRYEVKPDPQAGVKRSGPVSITKNADGSYGVDIALPPKPIVVKQLRNKSK
jgi:hypothetical protein